MVPLALESTCCHLVACESVPQPRRMLDPRYQSDNMQDSDMWGEFLEVCEKMLGPDDGNLAVQQYNMYQECNGIFGNAMAQSAKETMEPHQWWSSYGASTPQLRNLALKVLSQPASASSAEQSWSEYDYIHSKRRNRLKVAVARKLVYVHSNLRLLRNAKSCARYTDLLGMGVQQANEAQANSKEWLLTAGWDGNCSDCDLDEAECQSQATAVANSGHLDTSSFIARGHRDEANDR